MSLYLVEWALSFAFDDEGMSIGEFDSDIALLDTREFAVELVCVVYFSDIESRREGFFSAVAGSALLLLRLVERRE
jgi:hypothetical protein